MKKILSLIFFLALSSVLITLTTHAKPTTVVYPTGTFPTDVQNVQAAINQGGTVLLKATGNIGQPLVFNFGTPEALPGRWVIIENDVSIMAEVVGASRTTISGGLRPFRVSGGKNTISGIRFDGPLLGAIFIVGSTGTSIIGNKIENVVPLFLQGVGFTQADGIEAFNANVSGNLVISGNVIGNLTGDFSIGVNIDSVAAKLTITNNSFQLGQTLATIGFNNSSGIACVRCNSSVLVANNTIAMGPGLVFDGIAIVGGPDATYHVSGNNISGENPFTDGIDILGIAGDPGPVVAAVIEHNTITVHNSETFFSGIGVFGAVSNSTIQGNIIMGDAGAALNVDQVFLDDLSDQVVSNRFLFNDIASVTVSGVPIFLGANTVNNIVRGQCVDVIDLGVGNDISCPNSTSHAASFSNVTRQQLLQRALKAESTVRGLAPQQFSSF